MLQLQTLYRPEFQRTVERARRIWRSTLVAGEGAERRRLAERLPRRAELAGLLDPTTGYGALPAPGLSRVDEAIAFAQTTREDRRTDEFHHKKIEYNPTILRPLRYEDAPPFFDLALSDEILQIASDYLGEIPVLLHFRLWWTPVNDYLKGSQLYHRDGSQWLLKRAKFLFNMDDVDERSGPFTFLPAGPTAAISKKAGSMKKRITDEFAYRHADPKEAIALLGPAGTGMAVDSTRCYHHGARARERERLLLMFQFLRRADARDGGSLVRTPAFEARFGDDPVRKLVIPNHE